MESPQPISIEQLELGPLEPLGDRRPEQGEWLFEPRNKIAMLVHGLIPEGGNKFIQASSLQYGYNFQPAVNLDYYKLSSLPLQVAKRRGFLPAHWPLVKSRAMFSVPGVYLGSDPELFALNEKGTCIPAWSFLPDKAKAGPGAYWDGWQMEGNVAAGGCQDYFADRTRNLLADMQSRMPKGCKLSTQPVIAVGEDELEAADEKHVALGCSPSLNVYGAQGEWVANPRQLPWRFSGGHVHIGFQNYYTPAQLQDAVKGMDCLAGVAAVSLFPEESPLRRRYYGLAGEFRLPKHGLEYRTLSANWLRAPQLTYLVVGLARQGFTFGLLGYRKVFQASDEEVQRAINLQDVELAREIIRRNREIFELHFRTYLQPSQVALTMEIILEGVEKRFPEDLPTAWHFSRQFDMVSERNQPGLSGRWGVYTLKELERRG